MTDGWISAKSFLHWYDNPKMIKTPLGLGEPLFDTKPWFHRYGKQEARRCFNCGLTIFKSELNVRKTFYNNPFSAQLSAFAGVITALVAGLCFIILTFPKGLPVPEQLELLDKVSPIVGFRYYSGYYGSNPFPTIYAHEITGILTVVGRGMEENFPMQQSDSAFQAYRELLVENGYNPE